MTTNLSNDVPSSTLLRWVMRAMLLGLAIGVVAGMAALLN